MSKWMTLLSLLQGFRGKWMFGRLLSSIAILIALTFITAMMIGLLITGGFYAIYAELVRHDVDSGIALVVVFGIMALTTVILVLSTVIYVKRLRFLPHKLLQKESPMVFQLNEAIDAFVQGFLHPHV